MFENNCSTTEYRKSFQSIPIVLAPKFAMRREAGNNLFISRTRSTVTEKS